GHVRVEVQHCNSQPRLGGAPGAGPGPRRLRRRRRFVLHRHRIPPLFPIRQSRLTRAPAASTFPAGPVPVPGFASPIPRHFPICQEHAMLLPLGQVASDGRLLANLIAVHLLVMAWLGLSVALRWLLTHSSPRLGRWANTARLKSFSEEASRHGHTMLFWLTVTAMALTALGGIGYHLVGRDVRHDLSDWYSHLTPEDFLRLGLAV